MAIQPLPKPQEEPGPEPPLVELVRERLRESRFGGFLARHKTIAATLAGLIVMLKSGKWFLFQLWANGGWLLANWPITLGVLVAIFLIVFVSVRLGLGWFDDEDETAKAEAVIHARYQERQLERARDAATVRR